MDKVVTWETHDLRRSVIDDGAARHFHKTKRTKRESVNELGFPSGELSLTKYVLTPFTEGLFLLSGICPATRTFLKDR